MIHRHTNGLYEYAIYFFILYTLNIFENKEKVQLAIFKLIILFCLCFEYVQCI